MFSTASADLCIYSATWLSLSGELYCMNENRSVAGLVRPATWILTKVLIAGMKEHRAHCSWKNFPS